MIDSDIQAVGIFYEDGDIFIESVVKDTHDSNKWYSILSDGSGTISDCWNTDGDKYIKGTFNPVLKLAMRFKENQNCWSRFINKVFHYNTYQFTKSETLCLLDIVDEIEKGRYLVQVK